MPIKCPKCGTVSTDDDFSNGNEKVAVYMDDEGNDNCECWECEHKWVKYRE